MTTADGSTGNTPELLDRLNSAWAFGTIMAGPAIDAQIKAGKVVSGSRVDLAKSGIGVGVPKGAPKPDISTSEALKKTLLAAKSIGYSTDPSGVYMVSLFERPGCERPGQVQIEADADRLSGRLLQTATSRFDFSRSVRLESFLVWTTSAHFRPNCSRRRCSQAACQRSRRCPSAGQIPDDSRNRGGVQKARHGAGLKRGGRLKSAVRAEKSRLRLL